MRRSPVFLIGAGPGDPGLITVLGFEYLRIADVVVYDLEELDMDPQWTGELAHDLPAGEWRRVQRAKGYKDILVNGQAIEREVPVRQHLVGFLREDLGLPGAHLACARGGWSLLRPSPLPA